MTRKEYVELIKELHEGNAQGAKEMDVDPGEAAHDVAYSMITYDDVDDDGIREFLESEGVTDVIGRFACDIACGNTYFIGERI